MFCTFDDVVAIHINISMQLPAQTLKFEGKLFTHLNSVPQELINSQRISISRVFIQIIKW